MNRAQKNGAAAALSNLEGLATKLCGSFAVEEIERASEYLGKRLTDEQKRQLLKQGPQQIIQAAQLTSSAVALRQQTEAAEAVRRNIKKMEMMAAPVPKGPVS